jgi:hypothetical protein
VPWKTICLKLNLFKGGRLHHQPQSLSSKALMLYLEQTILASTKDLERVLKGLLS